jgi:hypothetical protein
LSFELRQHKVPIAQTSSALKCSLLVCAMERLFSSQSIPNAVDIGSSYFNLKGLLPLYLLVPQVERSKRDSYSQKMNSARVYRQTCQTKFGAAFFLHCWLSTVNCIRKEKRRRRLHLQKRLNLNKIELEHDACSRKVFQKSDTTVPQNIKLSKCLLAEFNN